VTRYQFLASSYAKPDQRLFEQFFALVEAAACLPPAIERRTAFRDVREYGTRIDPIGTRIPKQDRH
jgi:hypothetical protein